MRNCCDERIFSSMKNVLTLPLIVTLSCGFFINKKFHFSTSRNYSVGFSVQALSPLYFPGEIIKVYKEVHGNLFFSICDPLIQEFISWYPYHCTILRHVAVDLCNAIRDSFSLSHLSEPLYQHNSMSLVSLVAVLLFSPGS